MDAKKVWQNVYPNSKNTFKKTYNYKTKYTQPSKKKYKYKRYNQTQKPLTSQELSGFDKKVFKANKIISTIGHGFDVIGKPIKGVINLAKEINPFKNFFS